MIAFEAYLTDLDDRTLPACDQTCDKTGSESTLGMDYTDDSGTRNQSQYITPS